MRVLISGGVAFTDRPAVFAALAELYATTPVTAIIHGGCRGVDTFADEWATVAGVPVVVYPVGRVGSKHQRWHASRARAKLILSEGKPDLMLVFPGQWGTNKMAERAAEAGVPVVRIGEPPVQPPAPATSPPPQPVEALFVRKGEGRGARYVEAAHEEPGPKFRRAATGAKAKYVPVAIGTA